MNEDTPLTNAEESWWGDGWSGGPAVEGEFARTLERKLNAANKELAYLRRAMIRIHTP